MSQKTIDILFLLTLSFAAGCWLMTYYWVTVEHRREGNPLLAPIIHANPFLGILVGIIIWIFISVTYLYNRKEGYKRNCKIMVAIVFPFYLVTFLHDLYCFFSVGF